MYRKMGAVIEFADKTPKQMRFSVTPPFALDYVLARRLGNACFMTQRQAG